MRLKALRDVCNLCKDSTRDVTPLFTPLLFLGLWGVVWGCEQGSEPITESPSEMTSPDRSIIEIDATLTHRLDAGIHNDSIDGGEIREEEVDPEGVAPGDVSVLQLQEVQALNFGAFTTSAACALCHSNHFAATAMRNSAGEGIGPYNLWRGSMMANASRDPFWWAQVASEVALNAPEARDKIEGECIRCHAPALSETARSEAGREGKMTDLKGSSHPAMVGVDGVACTTCHQILPDNLGTSASFSGGYVINEDREIFGPHQNPATAPMINHVDYTPTHADHVTESKLCATCHTLLHEPRAEGEEWGFPEQTPYLEWRNSIYNNEEDPDSSEAKTCQACHQPTYDDEGYIRTRIARSPPGGDFRINPRDPFGQHTFVGANAVLPQIIKAERETLNSSGTDESLDLISDLAVERLESSAELRVEMITQESDTLAFKVHVTSNVGHKLPTGFPSRRVWLVVKVTSVDGEQIFYSGRYNPQGRIVNTHGEALPIEWAYGPVEPHHELITEESQVQIYEAVMSDHEGRFTHAVTKAKSWLKDNRILPKGYRRDHPEARYTLPVGLEDDNFIGGEDQLTYQVSLGSQIPAKIKVKLVYQTLGARFMRALFQVDVPEVAAFRTMYERADVSPIVMAETDIDL